MKETALVFWTHYWQRSTFLEEQARPLGLLEHAGSNLFRQRGVQADDTVFVISCFGGTFYVIGKIVVEHVVDRRAAAQALSYDPWDAADHLLAKPGTASPPRFDRVVSMDKVRDLEFLSGGTVVYPKFLPSGLPDRQTFRGVREVSASTAKLLDQTLRS